MRDEPKTLRASLGAQMKVPALPSYADDKTIMKRAGEILSESSARVKALIHYVLEPWR